MITDMHRKRLNERCKMREIYKEKDMKMSTLAIAMLGYLINQSLKGVPHL